MKISPEPNDNFAAIYFLVNGFERTRFTSIRSFLPLTKRAIAKLKKL